MGGGRHRYFQMESEAAAAAGTVAMASAESTFPSFRQGSAEQARVFDELPKASIVSASRSDAGDISPMPLSYTIEFQYKQFKWRLVKKASQVFILHFALKKRAFIEEIHEKQEQVKEWLQNLGIGDHTPVVQDEDEVDDDAVPFHPDESFKIRWVFCSEMFPQELFFLSFALL